MLDLFDQKNGFRKVVFSGDASTVNRLLCIGLHVPVSEILSWTTTDLNSCFPSPTVTCAHTHKNTHLRHTSCAYCIMCIVSSLELLFNGNQFLKHQKIRRRQKLFCLWQLVQGHGRRPPAVRETLPKPIIFSSSKPQVIKFPRNHRDRSPPSHGVVRKSAKRVFVRRKHRVNGRRKEEKKDDVTSHQR